MPTTGNDTLYITFPFTNPEGDLAQSLKQRQRIPVTSMSDKDRDAIEIEVKKFLTLLVGRIGELRRRVDKFNNVHEGFFSSKTDRGTIRLHRDNMLWLLDQKLIKTSNQFMDLLERRAKVDMAKREMYVFLWQANYWIGINQKLLQV
jgi:hypothetical protein